MTKSSTGSDKISRTLRLTPDLDARLQGLCEHLGVNPNAYLLNEVGKAISRDEVAFQLKKQVQEMFDGISDFQQVLTDLAIDDGESGER